MASNFNVQSITSMVRDLPLREILDSAEAVAAFVPFPGSTIIIKVLKILLLAQPGLTATAGLVGKQAQSSDDAKRATFDKMWQIAISDGIITEEEKKFLQPYAREAGISDAEFQLMIINYK